MTRTQGKAYCARLKNHHNDDVLSPEGLALLGSVWLFLKDPANLAVLGSIGAVIAAIATGPWAVFSFLAKKSEKGPPTPSVKADHGSVAAGRDITGPVTIGIDEKRVGRTSQNAAAANGGVGTAGSPGRARKRR